MTATTDTSSAMLIGLPEIAQLADVQRPVVSMWRRRPAKAAGPFPSPIRTEGVRELFDAATVVDWLESTGRGNNPHVREDVAAYASLPDAPREDPTALAGLTALLCVLVAHGSLPEDADELLDLADELDPDDEYLYSEVDALADRMAPLARYANRLADAAYSPAAAFERLMSRRFRPALGAYGRTDIAQPARDLVSLIALGLGTQADFGDTVLVDPTGGSGDLMIDLARQAADSGAVVVATPVSASFAGRLSRRRLRVHDVAWIRLCTDAQGGLSLPEHAVVVAQLPTADDPGATDIAVLRAMDEIALACTRGQRVVVVGPSSALTDRALPEGLGPGRPAADAAPASEVTLLRRDIIRTDLLRAIIRLPAGLVTTRPRERLALWCLGPTPDQATRGPIAHGTQTLVADLANHDLDAATIDALVADVLAGMYGRWGTAAHTLQLAQAVPTSTLQLADGDLVAPVIEPGRGESVTTAAVGTLRDLAERLRAAAPAFDPPDGSPQPAAIPPSRTTVAAALADRAVEFQPGLRLDEADAAAHGVRLVGPVDVLGGEGVTTRRIDPFALAARYPGSKLTRPGDVVFCTAPRPAAWVDRDGGSVAVFPAKLLRCRDVRLVPAVVAADINAQPVRAKAWRAWTLRRVPEDQAAAMAAATDKIAIHRADLLSRLESLDEFSDALITGTANGTLDLNEGEGT